MGENELVNAFQVELVQAENVLDTQFSFETALLHKSAPGQTSPTPGVATPQPPSADSPTL